MDREAVTKQMKVLKNKAKEARKAGKRDAAAMFGCGAQRLDRRLKASAPRATKKKEG